MSNVNVTLPDGRVVSVPEEDYLRAQRAEHLQVALDPGHQNDVAQAQREEEHRKQVYGGWTGTAMSGLGGALDAMTFGLGMRGLDALDPGVGESYRESVAQHPLANVGGELAGMALPTGEIAMAGRLARGGAEVVGAGRTATRLAEGAILGTAGTMAHATASGDPLTAESLVIGATVGGVLNYGLGAMGDRLLGVEKRAATEAATAERGAAAKSFFEGDSPGYDALRESREAARDASAKVNSEVTRMARAREAFAADPARYERLGDGLQRATADLRAQYDETFGTGDLGVLGREGELLSQMSPAQEAAGTAMRESLDDFERRLGEIRDGFRSGAPTALDDAARLRDDLVSASARPVANKIPAIPPPPGAPVAHLDVRLPETAREFARMSPEKIAEMGNHLNNWGAASASEVEALSKFARELGVQEGNLPGETLANVHQFLRDHNAVLAAMEKSGEPTASPLMRALKWAGKKALRGAVGGAVGSVVGGPGGKLAGEMLGLMTGGAMASSAAEARSLVQQQVRKVVVRYAGKTGRAAQKLGPVTAYLSRSWPSGKHDPETDLGALARNRVRELAGTSVTAADGLYEAVAPLMDGSGAVAQAIHGASLNALNVTVAAMPRDPRTSPGDWRPTPTEAVELAHRLEVLQRPLDALARICAGDAHPASAEHLRAAWPACAELASAELSMNPAHGAGISALSGAPRFGLDDPASTVSIQGMYLPKSSVASPPPATGAPLGRPPKAGRSSVAGSNVSELLTQ